MEKPHECREVKLMKELIMQILEKSIVKSENRKCRSPETEGPWYVFGADTEMRSVQVKWNK